MTRRGKSRGEREMAAPLSRANFISCTIVIAEFRGQNSSYRHIARFRDTMTRMTLDR